MQSNQLMRNAALDLVAKGYSVIPVGKNKRPLLAQWKPYQQSAASISEVEDWCNRFGDEMQIGIVTGKVSGVTVIDVEARGYWGDIPDTVKSKTGSGGRHFFYRYSGGLKNNVTPWPLADIRDDGAFVVVPPSSNTKGEYEWLDALERDAMSDFPMATYEEKRHRWQGLCKAYKGVAEGHRHDSMVSRAGTLLRRIPQEHWETEVWTQLKEDNRNNNPPLEDEELRRIFEDIGRKEELRRSIQPTVTIAPTETDKLIVHPCDEIMATPHKPDSFVIDRLIPEGMVTAITSQAGIGKSIIALEMARCIASGKPFLGQFPTKQMPVLIIDQEMSPNTIVGRFHSLIDDPTLPIFTSYETFLKITNPNDYRKIADAISEHGAKLVILDTLVTFHSGDENQVNEMREVMEAMMRLCAECKVTILVAHHQRKGSYGEQASQASMRGSTEIAAKIGCQITLESKGKEIDETTGETTATLTMEQHKSRLPVGFKKFTIKSVYNEKTGKTTIAYAGDCEEKKVRKESIKDDIVTVLTSNPGKSMLVKDFVDALGGSEKNLRDAVKEMVTAGLLMEHKTPGTKARMYSLPEPVQTELPQQEVDF